MVDQDHIGWKSWKLIARSIRPTSSLFVAQTKGHPPNPRGTWGNLGRLEVGWEKVACCRTKAAISLKRVKTEEKLLWRAYIGSHQRSFEWYHHRPSTASPSPRISPGKSSPGRTQGLWLWKMFRAPVYRAHRAVTFAVAQLSCLDQELVSYRYSFSSVYSLNGQKWHFKCVIMKNHSSCTGKILIVYTCSRMREVSTVGVRAWTRPQMRET